MRPTLVVARHLRLHPRPTATTLAQALQARSGARIQHGPLGLALLTYVLNSRRDLRRRRLGLRLGQKILAATPCGPDGGVVLHGP